MVGLGLPFAEQVIFDGSSSTPTLGVKVICSIGATGKDQKKKQYVKTKPQQVLHMLCVVLLIVGSAIRSKHYVQVHCAKQNTTHNKIPTGLLKQGLQLPIYTLMIKPVYFRHKTNPITMVTTIRRTWDPLQRNILFLRETKYNFKASTKNL